MRCVVDGVTKNKNSFEKRARSFANMYDRVFLKCIR